VPPVLAQPEADLSETTSTTKPETTTTTKPQTTTTTKPETTTTSEPKNTTTVPVDTSAPGIVIASPSEGQVFEQKEVVFEGTTEPGARVFAGEFEATVAADGTWSIVLWLSPGQNVATLKAIDAAGNISRASVTVVLSGGDSETDKPKDDKPETDKPKDDKPETDKPKDDKPKDDDGKGDDGKGDDGKGGDEAVIGFSAGQKYGSCGEERPYDVFFGTGRTGLVVEVGSPYGSGRVEVGKTGHWDMKVFFDGAPVGQTFDVTISTSDGDRKVFSFTNTGPQH
jgi:hypothetical protein